MIFINKELLNKEIIENYSKEDSKHLAKRLKISVQHLRVKAERLGVKRGDKANAIIDNKKLCAKCKKLLPITSFRKDRYQPNNLDYYCKECRNNLTNFTNKDKDKDKKQNSSTNKSQAFGISKTRNPIIYVNGVASLRCKVCETVKPLDDFHRASKNISGRMNICKKCRAKK